MQVNRLSNSQIIRNFEPNNDIKVMGKAAEYIKSVEIKSLWNGQKHIVWNLKPDVNILSGINGAGKSTILNRLAQRLSALEGSMNSNPVLGVKIDFHPSDATFIHYDLVRTFDRPLVHGDALSKLSDGNIRTETDFQLYALQRRYLDYQVNIGNRMISLLSSGDPDAGKKAQEATLAKKKFQDAIDSLFGETGKRIDRKSNEVKICQSGEELPLYKLSSGEKQMLIILLTALVEDNRPYVLFLDEPEASLHFEWQQKLISLIREMNPNAQVILTTHSPAVIMEGWIDKVTEVSDITEE